MADGEQPSRTWDNRVFEDVLRLGLIGVPLLFKACLVAIKGDWKEVAETFSIQQLDDEVSSVLRVLVHNG